MLARDVGKKMAGISDETEKASMELCHHRGFRCMIRLLRAQRLKGMSDDEWAEFLSLEHHIEAKKQRPRYTAEKQLLVHFSSMADAMVPETMLLKLYYAVSVCSPYPRVCLTQCHN
jgi:hypothetical protein